MTYGIGRGTSRLSTGVSKNSHDFLAYVPLIVQFVIYSLQNLLFHLNISDTLLQLTALEKCAVLHP